MLCFSRVEWKFQWGKYEWKKENEKGIRENAPSSSQKLGAFLQNKSVFFLYFIWLFTDGN